MKGVSILLACVVLAGCASAPYHAPDMPMPSAYREAGNTVHQVITQDWWKAYQDETLNTLIARIDAGSPTLMKSIALLHDARAQVAAARADYFPTIGAGASVTSTHLSANVLGHSLAGRTTPDHLLGLGASWEPDLFGRIGRNVDAAKDREQASVDDVAAVRLALQAEAAIDYFGIRSLDRDAALLQRTIATYESVLQLTENRYRGGIVAESDVDQARSQLETTRTRLADAQLARTQLLHALATLVGEPATSFSVPDENDRQRFQVPPTPDAVPATLLQRRPDIAAAERRVAAANAQIGVARAAFFPTLMLNLNGGLESSGLAGWLTAPSRFWAVGPALAATLFDGGKREAGVNSAQAQFDASAADYRDTVLKAVQDVEDNYAALRILADECRSQETAVAASERALQQVTERYRLGAVAYLDVSVVQATTLDNLRALESIHRRQLAASVSLYRALGGGWTVNDHGQPNASKRPDALRPAGHVETQ